MHYLLNIISNNIQHLHQYTIWLFEGYLSCNMITWQHDNMSIWTQYNLLCLSWNRRRHQLFQLAFYPPLFGTQQKDLYRAGPMGIILIWFVTLINGNWYGSYSHDGTGHTGYSIHDHGHTGGSPIASMDADLTIINCLPTTNIPHQSHPPQLYSVT